MTQGMFEFQSDDLDHQAYIALLIHTRRVRAADVALAKLLCQEQFDAVFYLVLLLQRAEQSQHTCLLLADIDWQNPFSLSAEEVTVFTAMSGAAHALPYTPFDSPDAALGALQSHPAVGESKPLRLFSGRLYLARLAEYEAYLSSRFLQMARQPIQLNESQLSGLLDQYFPSGNAEGVDWQKVACAMAASSGFCVITGGPGTGKTTTVTKLLAILQSLYTEVPLSIKLVAPTGKAAARLSESIIGAKGRLALAPELASLIPEQAQTVHRLLGVIPHTNRFIHHEQNPLHIDLLIVDEASMVDLALMSKLVRALPAHARLILLGDKDQLASVDTGSILSDLCEHLKLGSQPAYTASRAAFLNQVCFAGQAVLKGKATRYALADATAFLQQSHRFKSDSGIGQLASAVNYNLPERLQQVINHGFSDLSFYGLSVEQYNALLERAADHYSRYLTAITDKREPEEVHGLFSQYQLLAAVREGPYGVSELNKRIEQKLAQRGLIAPYNRFYAGMPIMITQNDYQLKLFNGDIGILLPDEQGQLYATFIDEQNIVRHFYPARLPSFELVYAMTIHKSQGSEFDYTALILPPIQRAGKGVNRQLVYTGITRAKRHLELNCQPQVLQLSMQAQAGRHSGMSDRLRLG
ncbi:exodeoxyribonuclease V subunit alpha [Pseudoalteromonas ardens]|uniref:RecBCD enzyme subunit RecD n=1 Tax=Pseudoalteromonas rubra TaxID=43658 RepID=A0A0L0EQD5_9GAMM|nr:exodeoxyribonuclease V subunit alpha [Pseudoalteromonas sp. R96]KNC66606.1 exonuclease V subunit alpha [Pseudoalteromonas rubra]MDK1311420.1 exodeoxyribonuclease V subunit alpha [Pseudoalteromonas sp. R96]